MKTVLYLFLVTSSYTTTAQHCGTIIDNKSKQPVQYATISCLRKPLGTYANDKGEFCIDVKKLSEKDTILLSGLGHRSLEMSLADFSRQTLFYLEEQNVILNEVVIKKHRYKTVDVGNFKKTLFLTSRSYGANSNALLATKIEKPAEMQQGIISKLRYRLESGSSQLRLDKKFRMRCRIFKDLNGKPGQDLLVENVVVDLDPKQNMLEVDVAMYNLPFDEQYLWLAIETLGYTDKDGIFILNQDGQFGKYIPKKDNSKKKIIDRLSPMFPYKKIGLQSMTTYYFSKTSKWLPVLVLESNENFLFGLTLDY